MTDEKPRPEVWRMIPVGEWRAKRCGSCGVPMMMVPGNPRADGRPSFIPLDLTTLRLKIEASNAVTGWEARSHFQTCTDPGAHTRGGR